MAILRVQSHYSRTDGLFWMLAMTYRDYIYLVRLNTIDNAIGMLEYLSDIVTVVFWHPSAHARGRRDHRRAFKNMFDHAECGGWVILSNVFLNTLQVRFRTRCPVQKHSAMPNERMTSSIGRVCPSSLSASPASISRRTTIS